MGKDDLFQLIPVLKRISNQEIAEYICLHNLEVEQYAVLCTNFYHPSSTNEDHISFKQQVIDLLLEESPYTRCEWFPSIKQAIHQHDLDFN